VTGRCSSDLALSNLGLNIDELSLDLRNFLVMYYIRHVEMKIAKEYELGIMRTPVHLCVGQEAIPAGVSRYLFPEDKVLSNHRSHGHFLAKGGSLQSLFSELLGRESGCARGRGGSQHLIDIGANFIASAPILGGTVPIGAGIAYSNVLSGSSGIIVVYLGDAVLEEGILYETLSFAALKSLPILFVVENNRLSVHTYIQHRQPIRDLVDIGKAFGLRSFEADGNDIMEILSISQIVMQVVRGERKPAIVFFETFRQLEHVGTQDDSNLGYRNAKESEFWLKRDPLEIAISYLGDLPKSQLKLKDQAESKIRRSILDAWDLSIDSDMAKYES